MPTATVTVTPNQAGRNALLGDPNGDYGRWLVRKLNLIANGAKQRANVDTGLMRSRIEYRLLPRSPLVGEVFAATNYAKWVHDGTRYYPGNPFLTDAARDVLR